MFEKTTNGSTTEYRHYIVANGKAVAVRKRVGSTDDTYYLHEDHLGSTDAITTQAGAKLVQLSYSAWGDRRGSGWTGAPSAGDIAAIGASTHRGFTKQEQLDNLSLVHLNGRVYDPTIGRFMSADPIVQNPYHSQSFNRYSYVWNNPLNATDPTGFVRCTGSNIERQECVDWETGNVVQKNDPAPPSPRSADSGNNSAQQTALTTSPATTTATTSSTAAQASSSQPGDLQEVTISAPFNWLKTNQNGSFVPLSLSPLDPDYQLARRTDDGLASVYRGAIAASSSSDPLDRRTGIEAKSKMETGTFIWDLHDSSGQATQQCGIACTDGELHWTNFWSSPGYRTVAGLLPGTQYRDFSQIGLLSQFKGIQASRPLTDIRWIVAHEVGHHFDQNWIYTSRGQSDFAELHADGVADRLMKYAY
jgi:RHS repeat-associated protein